MRVETVNSHKVVCGHIFPKDKLKVGQRWTPADGADRVVEIRSLETDKGGTVWVQYGVHAEDRTYETDWFNFQCRFCLIVEN